MHNTPYNLKPQKGILMKVCCLLATLSIGHESHAQQPQFYYDTTGRIVRSIHEVYDADNRLAVAIIYDYNDTSGAVETRTLKGYDKQGRLVRTEVYSDDDRLLFTDDIIYRLDGTIRKRKQRNYEE